MQNAPTVSTFQQNLSVIFQLISLNLQS